MLEEMFVPAEHEIYSMLAQEGHPLSPDRRGGAFHASAPDEYTG
jgi:hypothetical protein